MGQPPLKPKKRLEWATGQQFNFPASADYTVPGLESIDSAGGKTNIYRGHAFDCTDLKEPSDYIEEWQHRVEAWGDGGMIRFDGTIDKHGTRHTDLRIDISEEDVIALFDALVKAYRHRARELETWNASTALPAKGGVPSSFGMVSARYGAHS